MTNEDLLTDDMLSSLEDIPIEEEDLKVFEFDGFQVVCSIEPLTGVRTWTLEFDQDTTEDLDEEMAIVLEGDGVCFDEDSALFLRGDFGVEFTVEDMNRLKDHLKNEVQNDPT